MPYVNHSGRIVTRRRIKEWVTVYEDKHGNRILVRSFKRPTRHRVFRVSSRPGRRKFKAVQAQFTDKEIVLVAKTKKGKKKKEDELTKEELAELEELEDLDDLEDDDEDDEDEVDDDDTDDEDDDDDSDDEDEDDDDSEDDDDDDDEDEDDDDDEDEDEDEEDDDDADDDEDEEDEGEEPPAKKSKKSKSKKGKSRASADGKVGTQEVADACGIDGRTLRMVLRKHAIPKDPDTNRYEWSSLKHPEVRKIVKLVKERGEGRKVKQESLDNLKKGRTKKTKKKASSSKTSGTKTKKKGTKKKSS